LVREALLPLQLQATFSGIVPPTPAKVKLPVWQGIEAMLTVTYPPGDNLPLAGLKVTPLRLLLAVQLALLCELEVSASVIWHWWVRAVDVHCALLASKLLGLTFNVGVVGTGSNGLQLHDRLTELAPPDQAKVNVPCWQGIPVMITLVEFPGESSPLAREKFTPLKLLLAVQFTFPCELEVSARSAVHW
jgi:hypothetical protein